MQLGDVLADRFVVEAEVNRGGMGVIYRGWDLDAGAPVAIKRLAKLSQADVARFRREAGVLAGVAIPGLVRHVSHGDTPDGVPYLVMEWLDGPTVAQRLEDPGHDVADAVALVRALCDPLAELHARTIVHRDLKPENLVVTGAGAGEVVIVDLGLARMAGAAEPRVTATGCVLGTPGYMAPEQIRGDAVDVRADVFALGCVLYECVTGYAAFAGENFLAVRAKILVGAPPPLRLLCAEAPPQLADLVEAMLAKPAADRPSSAREVAAAIDAMPHLAPGPRRTWHAPLPPTQIDPGGAWRGVVVARHRSVDPRWSPRPPVTCEPIDADHLVLTAPPTLDHASIARGLADAALAMRRVHPGVQLALVTGSEPIGELVDRGVRFLEARTRAARFGDRSSDRAILVDAATARLLTDERDAFHVP